MSSKTVKLLRQLANATGTNFDILKSRWAQLSAPQRELAAEEARAELARRTRDELLRVQRFGLTARVQSPDQGAKKKGRLRKGVVMLAQLLGLASSEK